MASEILQKFRTNAVAAAEIADNRKKKKIENRLLALNNESSEDRKLCFMWLLIPMYCGLGINLLTTH